VGGGGRRERRQAARERGGGEASSGEVHGAGGSGAGEAAGGRCAVSKALAADAVSRAVGPTCWYLCPGVSTDGEKGCLSSIWYAGGREIILGAGLLRLPCCSTRGLASMGGPAIGPGPRQKQVIRTVPV
jgi:hypothetical protein